ncbi:uncharacterized protein LOC113460896 isoform X8 [Zonotrichia albicollis]|uniref:uncharacterized protein LOC113460896 isoform X8 n=1 Tax=Zonotrichia albicollis TaxID=44394 RepID=UPI003D80BFD1
MEIRNNAQHPSESQETGLEEELILNTVEFKESKFSTAAAFTNSRCEDLRWLTLLWKGSHLSKDPSLAVCVDAIQRPLNIDLQDI